MNNESNVRNVQIISVIEVKSVIGEGTKEDPHRIITQYWSIDGELLATNELSNLKERL